VWDFAFGKVGKVTCNNNEWSWDDMRYDIIYNKMFIDEIEHLFNCITQKKQTNNSIHDAVGLIKLALAAEQSSQSRQWVRVN